ncbi:NAD(P)H-binding protein [Paenibacillus spiritus]|uniref:NAD(P)H-binding protein n=1 Tax=Paenibacillus spiritus TaxID=2496557 RepID=A0A5J5GEW9_9BACL|nr:MULTISPECIES: NAD(P)H-binding protein [Paenibacillus]KAA9006567.1 NAD(P)H-binding protein [Paenibacillus spiritus]
MQKVLILGANGGIARVAIDLFLRQTDAQLTLYLRNARRLKHLESDRVKVMEGNVLNLDELKEAMTQQDVVYANLAGPLKQMAETIVDAMHATGLRRLIFISSMGIYGEVPGEEYRSILDPYRDAAAVIEASDLDYTILRPAWFTNADEVDFETTTKGEPFKGSIVSRKSVADLVVKLALDPHLKVRQSVGMNKPE